MTAKWKHGATTFMAALLLGLIARAAVLWLFRHDESRFVDIESLGVMLMFAAFAGLSAGNRK